MSQRGKASWQKWIKSNRWIKRQFVSWCWLLSPIRIVHVVQFLGKTNIGMVSHSCQYIYISYKPYFTSAVAASQHGDKEVLQYAIPLVLERKQPSKVIQLTPLQDKCRHALQNSSSFLAIFHGCVILQEVLLDLKETHLTCTERCSNTVRHHITTTCCLNKPYTGWIISSFMQIDCIK